MHQPQAFPAAKAPFRCNKPAPPPAPCWRIFCLIPVHAGHFTPQRTRTVHTNAQGSPWNHSNRARIHCSYCSAPSWCWPCTRASPFWNWAQCARKPGQRAGQNPGGFFSLHRGVFHRGLWRCLWHPLLCRRRNPGNAVDTDWSVLLPADVCRSHPPSCRAALPNDAKFGPSCWQPPPLWALSTLLRRHRLEPAFWRAGLDQALTGEVFHDFAGSVVVHAVGGWIALPAVLLLGRAPTATARTAPSRPTRHRAFLFLALGSWVLVVGWFGFNVMSAQTLDKISGWSP